MEQIFGTFVNIIVYIVIFRVIAGGFSKKKPEKNAPVKVEKNILYFPFCYTSANIKKKNSSKS